MQDPSILKWVRTSPYLLADRLNTNEICSIVSIANMTTLSARDGRYYDALNNNCKKGSSKNYWKLMNSTKFKTCSIAGVSYNCFDKMLEPYVSLVQMKNNTKQLKNNQCGLTLVDRLNYFTNNWLELKSAVNIRYSYVESARITCAYYTMKNIQFYGDSILKQVANAFQYGKHIIIYIYYELLMY